MTYLSCLFVGGVCAPHCSSDMNSHNAVAFVDNKHIVFSPRHFYLKKTYIIHYLEEFYRAKTGDQTVFFSFTMRRASFIHYLTMIVLRTEHNALFVAGPSQVY